jgi:SAM-dependent methyltransferase
LDVQHGEERSLKESHGADPVSYWEGHYGRRPQVWSGNPNGLLVELAGDLAAGTALDVGCGEGADAVWLASRGWRVTAVDVSATALERGARIAEAAGVAELIEWQAHDLARSFPSGSYDLVTAQYLHSPIDFPRDDVLRAAAAAVAPGGTLLVVGHAASPPWSAHEHPHEEFPVPAETAGALGLYEDPWVLEVCEVRERQTIGPNGEPATISDGVVLARRR